MTALWWAAATAGLAVTELATRRWRRRQQWHRLETWLKEQHQ